jgi:hypothetical protein
MKPFHRILPALAITACLGACAPRQAQQTSREVPAATRQSPPDAITLAARDSYPRVVISPSAGGRVVFYGWGGDNILWTDPAAPEQGGFQCDIGPQIARLPAHPELLSSPYDASSRKGYLVTLKSPRSDSLHLELEKEIQYDPNSGDVGFVHRMKNLSERDAAYSFWHRIACRPGGFVLIPLNAQSRFPARWSVLRQAGDGARYDGNQPDAPGTRVLDDVLIADTGSGSAQIGADSTAQWIAYATGRQVFVIHFPIYPSAVYSESGNTVTVAWNDRFTELQPYGPEARIRSRRSYDFPLKWAILELPSEIQTHEEARALADRIPSSPFL